MAKKITLTLFFILGIIYSQSICAQAIDNDIAEAKAATSIESLSIYPNPVSTGKLYIITKDNFTKQVEIFNVLGKRIFNTSLNGKELNISKIKEGIYILKVTENNITATRKLIVK